MKRIIWILGLATVTLLVVTGLNVQKKRDEHERLLHLVWHASYYADRIEKDTIPVWTDPNDSSVKASYYESRNGCRYRRLWVRIKRSNGGMRITLLTSRTINMWGYSQYGWEPWNNSDQEVMAVIHSYKASLDEKTSEHASGWVKHDKL